MFIHFCKGLGVEVVDEWLKTDVVVRAFYFSFLPIESVLHVFWERSQ